MSFPDFKPSMPVFIRELQQRYGERELIVFEGQRLGYNEAFSASACMAKAMLASGIGKGTRVGILMPNSPNFVVTWFAAARIGAIIIPINTFYKAKELVFVLRHGDIEVLMMVDSLLNNDYLERLEDCLPQLSQQTHTSPLYLAELPLLRHIYVWGEATRPWSSSQQDLLAGAKPAIDDHFLQSVEDSVCPADPLAIIYSSGSTADPKGAIFTHGSIIRHSYNLNSSRDLLTDDRLFSPMPFFWVGGLIFTLHCALHKGAFLICEASFEPGKTLKLLETERATSVTGWPHYGKAMVDHPSFSQRDLSCVRTGNIYALLPAQLRPSDPELRSNALGMTETCGPHAIDRMDVDLPPQLRGSFGRALEGVEHKIVDADSGDTLPCNSSGEICVRGYNVMQGLYKVEREDCFDVDGFYHTGDGGYLNEDDFLFFEARLGDMIKTAGANVSPREVEVIIDAQPEVQSSSVVGLPHPDRGQEVVAAVVLNQGRSLTAADLNERLKRDLSAYKLPKKVVYCRKQDIPFTDSGKVDKRRLIEYLTRKLG